MREKPLQAWKLTKQRAALNQRIYSNHLDIHAKDWIYYKTNVDRVWKGPVRVTSKEGKRLYILSAGQLLTVNTDDVLLHKSEDQFNAVGDEFISIPNPDKETSTAQNSANVIISGDRDPSVDPDIDLGFPVMCNRCEKEMSSKMVITHYEHNHNSEKGSIRKLFLLSEHISLKIDVLQKSKIIKSRQIFD